MHEGNGHRRVERSAAPPSAEVAAAQADIERTREKVAQAVLALKRELSRQIDWREWVRRRPGVALGLGFTLGFLLARRR